MQKVIFLQGPSAYPFANDKIKKCLKIIRTTTAKAALQDSSVAIFHPSEVRQQIELWKTHLHNIKPFYAIKCNSNRLLLKILREANCSNNNNNNNNNLFGYDCASYGEIQRIQKEIPNINFKQDIILSNPFKLKCDLQLAQHNGIIYTVADTIEELIKIHQHHPQCNILWRIDVVNPIARICMSNKFGANIQYTHDALKYISEHDNNINFKGFHFHIGSGGYSMQSGLECAQQILLQLIPIVYEHKLKLSIINMGGGFTPINFHQDIGYIKIFQTIIQSY
jgi:ornithine decarboxylase